jgi:cell cycle sensor histidine kinase DivJ
VNLVLPVRAYIDSLVHASARADVLTAARHRSFIAPRILVGFLALGALPIYLVAKGPLTPLDAVVFAWFLAPIWLAYFLSRTGRYDTAQVLSSLALTGLVTLIAAMSGGLQSPAAVWLLLVPLEAALCASRRGVLLALASALAAALGLFMLGALGVMDNVAQDEAASPALSIFGIALASVYAVLLALEAEALGRTGLRLLNQEEERYRLLAWNMTDVISRHGRGGTAQFVSPAAERLFGVPAQSLLGHGLFDRVHVADRPAYLGGLAEAAASGGNRSVEFRVRRDAQDANGRERPQFLWVEMRCRSLAPEEAVANAAQSFDVVAVMRDVTDRKAQEQAVAAARNDAEQANVAKSRFLATMSHELRTPLNAVIGFSEMLMHEGTMNIDAERRHEYARLIHDSGHHLLSVVNLVLDMSKIESGNFIITAEPFAPAPVIRNCCDLMALKARESGLDIVVRVAADLPEIVADKRALKQMLFNLLSNAIKFTDRGGKVTVGAIVEAGRLVLTIEDTGVGIGEADLPRIGDAFFQARSAYDRPYEGTGLGLSIVKGLVDLHGGVMRVESHLGVGTCVTIRLPLDCESGIPDNAQNVVELDASPRRELAAPMPEDARDDEAEVKKSA